MLRENTNNANFFLKAIKKFNVPLFFLFVSVVKRSADLHEEAKFAQFSGKGITEIDIVNLEDAASFEQANPQ